MKILYLSILAVFLVFVGMMLSYDNAAYGIWVRQSPQELLNDSTTIFVGNITSVNVLQFEKETSDIIEENGIEKNVVKNYTLSIDEYTVNIEEFLKNPQITNKITVRQPITSLYPGMLGGLDEFHVGNRVLFYIKNLDGNNTYSPESFIIPKSCVATNVLTQNRLVARGESFEIQNGIKVDRNFTANKPIQFVDNEDVGTLSGKSLDTMVQITKNTGSNAEVVFNKEIHSEAKPCEWIASAEWEFTPQEGEYRMYVTMAEDNKTYAQYSSKFYVKSDAATPDYVSPLKQFKSGIPANNVQCEQDFELIIRSETESPACVESKSATVLILRGWGHESNDGQILYFMKLNSTGKLSVKYTSTENDGSNDVNPEILNGTTMQRVSPTLIELEADHRNITSDSNTITYTIKSHDAKGVYWLSLDWCRFVPIVVGLDNSTITDSDLQFSSGGLRCPVSFLQYEIVGFEGIDPEYVRIP